MDDRVTIRGEYTLHKLLGRGKFGSVFLATRNVDGEGRPERLVAYKLITVKNDAERADVNQEIQVLQAVRGCPNTLKIIAASRVALTARQGGKEMFIVTEYYNGGTLESIRTALCDTPKCAKRVAILVLMQMAKALACMHDAGYVHADLKPDNILFSVPEGTTAITLANVNSLRFILADYGLAQRVGASKVMSGTPLFMAPEAFDNGPASPARDIWALGVLMYLLIYNVYPYTATTLGGLLHALKSPPTFPTASETQPALVQLVKRMLSRDPTQRPTARDIIAEVPRIASSA